MDAARDVVVLLLEILEEVSHRAALPGRIPNEHNLRRILQPICDALVELGRFRSALPLEVRLLAVLEVSLVAAGVRRLDVRALFESMAPIRRLEKPRAMMIDEDDGRSDSRLLITVAHKA